MAKLATIEASSTARQALMVATQAPSIDADAILARKAMLAAARARGAQATKAKAEARNEEHETRRGIQRLAESLSEFAIISSDVHDETMRRAMRDNGVSQASQWEALELYGRTGRKGDVEIDDDASLDDARPEAMPLFLYTSDTPVRGVNREAFATFYCTPTKGIYAIVARASFYDSESRSMRLSRMLQPSDFDATWIASAIAYACDEWRRMAIARNDPNGRPEGFRWIIDTSPYPGTADCPVVETINGAFRLTLTSSEALQIRFETETYRSDALASETRPAHRAGDARISGFAPRTASLKHRVSAEVSSLNALAPAMILAAEANDEWASDRKRWTPRDGVVKLNAKRRTSRGASVETNTKRGKVTFRRSERSTLMPWLNVGEARAMLRSASYAMACGFALNSWILAERIARAEAEATARAKAESLARAERSRFVANAMLDSDGMSVTDRVAFLAFAA